MKKKKKYCSALLVGYANKILTAEESGYLDLPYQLPLQLYLNCIDWSVN